MEPARVGRSRCASNGARPLPCLIGQPRTFLNRKKGASYRSHSKNAPVIKVYPPISKTDGAITDGKISMKRSSRTRAIHEAKSRRRKTATRAKRVCHLLQLARCPESRCRRYLRRCCTRQLGNYYMRHLVAAALSRQ